MENPILAQRNAYGEKGGPPMLFTAELTARFPDQPTWIPPRLKKKDKKKDPQHPQSQQTPLHSPTAQALPCELPEGFPPELAYRSLATYTLLRTLSIPLRLSPFTPNAFLKALSLPYPNKLLGDVHVAILRILLPHLQLGYSYKDSGGGVGISKRRHLDNVRWPLRAGDNLTHLDGYTWPLFYDDYCHLTADRLWESYNGGEEDTTSNSRFIDFRSLGLSDLDLDYGDDATSPVHMEGERPSRNLKKRSYQEAEDDENNLDDMVQEEAEAATSSAIKNVKRRGRPPKSKNGAKFKEEIDPADDGFAGDSDMEEYKDNANDGEDSDDDDWGSPNRQREKRRRLQNTNAKEAITSNPSELPTKILTSPQLEARQRKKKVSQDIAPRTSTASMRGSKVLSVEYAEPTATIHSEAGNDKDNNVAGPERIRGGGEDLTDSEVHDSTTRLKRGRVLPMHTQSNHQSHHQWQRRSNPVFAEVQYHSSSYLLQQRQQWLALSGQQPQILRESKGPPNRISSLDQMTQLKMHQRQEMESKGPFLVPDEVATFLQNFIRGDIAASSLEVRPSWKADLDQESANAISDDKDFESQLQSSQWVHFTPLERLRAGVPYRRLSLDHKLNILEFLTDELLQMEAFSALFSERHDNVDLVGFPYGSLPTNDELDNLQNEDECGVCREEGDLLCCDGCVNSYHKECLGMAPEQDLAEGKWLCPECEVVDPCKLGPLHGGRKGTLEWFRLDDIRLPKVHTPTISEDATADKEGTVLMQTNSMASSGTLSDEAMQTTETPSLALTNHVQSSIVKNDVRQKLEKMEFLVVNGYLFGRMCSESNQSEDSATCFLRKPPPPSSDAELTQFLLAVGVELSGAWPLAQIPRSMLPGQSSSSTPHQYLSLKATSDPCLYQNKYHSAPVSLLTKAGGIHQVSRLQQMNYEKQCHRSSSNLISEVLIKDLAKGYMLELENTLHRACMIDPSWDGGEHLSRSEMWISRVRVAKSTRRLARLLIGLVDEINPRVFDESWFQNLHTKVLDPNVSVVDRNFQNLPDDWSIEREKALRKWQTTPPKLILSLCNRDGSDLARFAKQIRSDIYIAKPVNLVKSKRKPKVNNDSTPMDTSPCSNETSAATGEGNAGFEAHGNALDDTKIEMKGDSPCVDINRKPEITAAAAVVMGEAAADDNDNLVINQIAPGVFGNKATTMEKLSDPIGVLRLDAGYSGEPTKSDSASLDRAQRPHLENDCSALHSKETIVNKSSSVEAEEIWATMQGEIYKSDVASRLPATNVVLDDVATSHFRGSENSLNMGGNKPSSSVQVTLPTQHREFAKVPPSSDDPTAEADPPKLNDVDHDNINIQEVNYTKDADDDTQKQEGIQSSPLKKTTKKKTKAKRPGNPSRRNARRSGRQNFTVPVQSPVAESVAELPRLRPTSGTLVGMALQVENEKNKKVPGLEKLVKGQYIGEGIWPVAGRLIFPTVGDLPFRDTKRLARNAGAILAADLAYHTSHEVAQVCVSHIWRKRMASCTEFEELLLLIRILESSMDRQTIHSCEGASKRGKAGTQKVIQCSLRNASTGTTDHFVVNKKNMKGCWMSNSQVDVSSLIFELYKRRQSQIQPRLQRLREKQKADVERQKAERALRLEEEKKEADERLKVAAQVEAERIALLKKMQEEERRKLEEVTKQKTTMALATRQEQLAKQAPPQPMNSQKMHSHAMNDPNFPAIQVAKLNNNIQLALSRHGEKLRRLLRECIGRGETTLPETEILGLRGKTMAYLRSFTDGLRQCNAPVGSDDTLMKLIFEKERTVAQSVNQSTHRHGDTVQTNNRSVHPSASGVSANAQGFQAQPQPSLGRFPVNDFSSQPSPVANHPFTPTALGIHQRMSPQSQYNATQPSDMASQSSLPNAIPGGTPLPTGSRDSFKPTPMSTNVSRSPWADVAPNNSQGHVVAPNTIPHNVYGTVGILNMDLEPEPIKEYPASTIKGMAGSSNSAVLSNISQGLSRQQQQQHQQQKQHPVFSQFGTPQPHSHQHLLQLQTQGINWGNTGPERSTNDSRIHFLNPGHPAMEDRAQMNTTLQRQAYPTTIEGSVDRNGNQGITTTNQPHSGPFNAQIRIPYDLPRTAVGENLMGQTNTSRGEMYPGHSSSSGMSQTLDSFMIQQQNQSDSIEHQDFQQRNGFSAISASTPRSLSAPIQGGSTFQMQHHGYAQELAQLNTSGMPIQQTQHQHQHQHYQQFHQTPPSMQQQHFQNSSNIMQQHFQPPHPHHHHGQQQQHDNRFR